MFVSYHVFQNQYLIRYMTFDQVFDQDTCLHPKISLFGFSSVCV